MDLNEAEIRIRVNKMLEDVGWDITDSSQVMLEKHILNSELNSAGRADYILNNKDGAPIAVIECKNSTIDPYTAKEQTLPYAKDVGAPFIFLTNAEKTYFWDIENSDAKKVGSIFSQKDMERLVALRKMQKPISSIPIPEHYTRRGKLRELRDYQKETMKALDYARELGKPKFLIQLPTGTGKTDLTVLYLKRLLQSSNADRILFLVDREELAKQAIDAIQDILPKSPSYWLKAGMDIQYKQITVTLLQTMVNRYESFSSGFFDVIVSDECHRSIYGVWQKSLNYFDAFHIGLTATPSEFIEKNTFKFYGCEKNTPDFTLPIKDAFRDNYLVPYTFSKSITKILNKGIDVDDIHYSPSDYYRKFFNKDTDEKMMEQFEKEAWAAYKSLAPKQEIGPGKTIIFAINKKHANNLTKILNGLHPELNGKYAEIITSDVHNVDEVITRFKREKYPQIGVSVGMLDTGFDLPSVLHIVMARPIRSAILYQQMRGRGTRLCDSIGKNRFMIYDFFGNHDYFNDSDTDPFSGSGWGYIPKPGEVTEVYKERVLKELDIEDEWVYRGTTIDYGLNGEEIDNKQYITEWENAINKNFSSEVVVEKIRKGEEITEDNEKELTELLNQPEFYFNEMNLRRAYKQPLGSVIDFVKFALGDKKPKSVEDQVKENFEAWVITQNLEPEQADFMRLLRNRFIANGEAKIEDLFKPPLSQLDSAKQGIRLFGGEDRLVNLIEDLNKTIFEKMKMSA